MNGVLAVVVFFASKPAEDIKRESTAPASHMTSAPFLIDDSGESYELFLD